MSRDEWDDDPFTDQDFAEALTAAVGRHPFRADPARIVKNGRSLRRRRRVGQSFLSVGVLAGVTLGATQLDLFREQQRRDVAVAVPSPISTVESQDCSLSPEAIEGNEAWRSTAGAQEATRRVDRVIEAHFGVATKADPRQTLREGLIGVVGNEVQNQLVVVVDPSRVDTGKLRQDLESARAAATSTPSAEVAVIAACRTAADLLRAGTVISERAWHPDADKVTFSSSLNADTSQWDVTMPEGPAARALADQLGNLVKITHGTAGRI